MLPTLATQQRLAELTGMPVEELTRLVWASKRGGERRAPAAVERRPAASPRRPGMRWRGGRSRPLGLQFTMYTTRGLDSAQLERLHALATARRTSLEATLNEALKIALPLLERRGRRP
jgi:hypothetical protein